MQREIVLDTETTGLDPRNGDRLIEIGCIELMNRLPTGREYHCFINPQRDVPAAAEAVHGLSTQFLQDKPLFEHVVEEFLAFIGSDTLVIHNASFDIGFLNAELERANRQTLMMDRVVDTLALARRKHPGGSNNLDALCKRYGIDNSKRVKHGALMDSVLLAAVYLELLGERQSTLELSRNAGSDAGIGGQQGNSYVAPQRPTPLPGRLSAQDEKKHVEFVRSLGADAVWLKCGVVPENEDQKIQ